MTPLSTLPTGTRFTTPAGGTYIRLTATAWNQLRENPDHWLHGISPQVERRSDVIYVADADGVLSLMQPDTMVEPLPAAWPSHRYRVTVEQPGKRDTYGVDMLDTVRSLIRALGMTTAGLTVAIECEGQHINADGTPCREQGKGLQFRAVESRVMIGSINL